MASVLRVICVLGLFLVGSPWLRLPAAVALISIASAQESATVWVNTASGVYHCPGSRYYGKTKAGEYMAEAAAEASGNRAAYGQSCGGTRSSTAAQSLSSQAPAGPSTSGVKVWVNSRSGVYHCPGSQYYGSTRSGEFMAESQARASGNRPAYGRGCGG
jgi:hypothetical protein